MASAYRDTQDPGTCELAQVAVLYRRESLNPEPQLLPSSVCHPPWFALHVRSRKENSVADQLALQGFETFVPNYRVVRRWSDRLKELEQPLFPGYLFARFELDRRRLLLATPGVIQIVSVGQVPTAIDESELDAIRRALDSGLPIQPWPCLETGERVRVTYGNLRTLEGILICFKGNHRVVLSIKMLQRAVAFEVDLAWVTPVREVAEPTALQLLPSAATETA
jgi:transcription antitermination factor NusG